VILGNVKTEVWCSRCWCSRCLYETFPPKGISRIFSNSSIVCTNWKSWKV